MTTDNQTLPTTALARVADKGTAREILARMEPQLRNVLPAMLTPERMVQVTMLALSKTPALYDCTGASLATAVMECATLGLVPDGVQGHAYLLPFRNRSTGRKEAKLIPGYRGYVTLARRAGVVLSGHAVRERDRFAYRYGLDENLEHEPHRGPDAGKLVAAYAVARQQGMAPLFLVLEAHEIQALKASSMGARKPDSPWNVPEHEPWMWTKSAIRALAKFLDLTPQLARAVELEDAGEQDRPVDPPDGILELFPEEQPEEPASADPLDAVAASLPDDEPPHPATAPQRNLDGDPACAGCGTELAKGARGCPECGLAVEPRQGTLA